MSVTRTVKIADGDGDKNRVLYHQAMAQPPWLMFGLALIACSSPLPPEVARIVVTDSAPGVCRDVGAVTGVWSGNDEAIILARAQDELRKASAALGATHAAVEETQKRGVPLGPAGMGGVGTELTLVGRALVCKAGSR